jgi:lysozyme
MKRIRKGDNGDEALFVQRLLNHHGFKLATDGDFGAKTEAAVRQFQINNRLAPDSVVGNNTWEKLFEETRKKMPNQVFKGTDVYHWDLTKWGDNKTFWDELQKGEFWFCFVKASQGSTREDPRFVEHMANLKKINLPRGAYHFPRLLRDNVLEEVEFFLDAWAKCGEQWTDKGILPPVYDVEPLGEDEAAAFKSYTKSITERMKRWLGYVERKTQRQPIIYTTRRNWDELLRSPKGFEDYPLWVADYGGLTAPRLPSIWKEYKIWQYNDKAVIGGVGGRDGFDINSLSPNVSLGEFLKLANY